ncbi:MAG: ROK family transcriptional regulator [Planctomycetes bacterium]|nr:ROK family transcriptional regulator [Planctomycetota bacterium]MCH9723801.1 ROK family transcriptional regulator [Planctomycetota bacterium]MCH9776113.1 ROK family transcriptional regulator [Planctomycetota bacterium]MCH9791408.1 ROK family transcriptional regulator [Planctomycetota bacterium]MDF1742964.1 ROK family transcriptional regulator [Gimesia sp.]
MQSPHRPSLLRKMNVRKVLEVIQGQGTLTRADVMRCSGISAPTVSKAVSALLDAGLLEERETAEFSVGRPGKLLQLPRFSAQVIGVVLEWDYCSVVASGLDGHIHQDKLDRFKTPKTYADLIETISGKIQNLVEQQKIPALGVGITVPGLVNSNDGRIFLASNLHIVDGQAPAVDIANQTNLECVLVQKSTALCLSEKTYGAGQAMDDFINLDVVSGFGMGVFTGGQLLDGQHGLAGEIAHITVEPEEGRVCGCGNQGCLETVATDLAFTQNVSQRLGKDLDFDAIQELVKQGEIDVTPELDRTIEFLAIGVAAAINIFNPSNIFITSRLFDLRDDVFDKMTQMAKSRALRPSASSCEIEPSKGNKYLGAVAGIINHLANGLGPRLS